jgi:(1->4)-alpha-D-glucan 1-alpha-D-glucosylmutase
MKAYAVKAAREGKQETSWLSPNEAYEHALTQFVERLLDSSESAGFLKNFGAFARRTSLLGSLNAISQLVLKATIPGVPDFYQGTELLDLSLVDPDNRRPVDFDLRVRLLSECSNSASWGGTTPHGSAKLALTRRLLKIRAESPELFLAGRYIPMNVTGPHREHVIAFARVSAREAIVVAVGRHLAPFTQGGRHWPAREAIQADIKLENFRIEYDLLHGSQSVQDCLLPVSTVFGDAPVAVLRASRV